MSQPTTQRPPQVTLASGIVMFSSVMVLLTVWERVSTLGSLETRRAIEAVLADPPFSSWGLTVASTTELLRVCSMVAAVCACATAILGWYVRSPDRSARLGLLVFALPLFLTDVVLGVFGGALLVAGSFTAAGAAMLWMQPGREWFATGRWTPPAPATSPPARDQRSASTPSPPPSSRPFGDPRSSASPVSPLPPPPGWPQRVPARPAAMVAAFVITVVTAGGLFALSVLWILVAGLSPDLLMSAVEQQQPQLIEDGLTLERLQSMVFVIAAVFIVWCAVALVLAGFAMARREWARRGLMISATFSAVACFALVLDSALLLIAAAPAVATVVCLRRVDVRRWFSLDAR